MKKISARDENPEQKARVIVDEAKEELGGLSEVLDGIKERVEKTPSIDNAQIMITNHILIGLKDELIAHYKEIVADIKDLGLPREHPLVQEVSSTVNELGKKMQGIANYIMEKASIPEAEGRDLKGIDTVEGIDMKGLTTEEIQDKILDLYAKLKEAISQKEKQAIQAKIQELHRML